MKRLNKTTQKQSAATENLQLLASSITLTATLVVALKTRLNLTKPTLLRGLSASP